MPTFRVGAIIGLLAVLAACTDQPTEPPRESIAVPPPNLSVTTSCQVTAIYQHITYLTRLKDAIALNKTVTLILSLSTKQQAYAQRFTMALAAKLADPEIQAQLQEPPTSVYPPPNGKAAASAKLVALVGECAGIAASSWPPPEAYLPSGGAGVFDENGGSFTTNDQQGGTAVCQGCVTGQHLFTMSVVPTSGAIGSSAPSGLSLSKTALSLSTTATATCLQPPDPKVTEVGRCFKLTVTPDVGAKSAGQGFGGVGVYVGLCAPGNEGQEVHTYLRLAKQNHASLTPPGFTIYPSEEHPINESLACDLGPGPSPPSASRMGAAWSKVSGAFAMLTRPFRPTVARASDGAGSHIFDYSNATLVYKTEPLTVSPASKMMETGTSQAFTASGPRPGPFVWSVNAVDVGSPNLIGTLSVATNGLSATYTAPATVPTPATFDVCVRRQAAPADKGCASVTVKAADLASVQTEGSAVATWQDAASGKIVFTHIGWTIAGPQGFNGHAHLIDGTDWTYTFTANESGTFSLDYDITIDPGTNDNFGLNGFNFWWAQGGGPPQFEQLLALTTKGTRTKQVVAGTTYTVRVDNQANVSGSLGNYVVNTVRAPNWTAHMSATFNWSVTPNTFGQLSDVPGHLGVTPVSSSLQLIASSDANGVVVKDEDGMSQAGTLNPLSATVTALSQNAGGVSQLLVGASPSMAASVATHAVSRGAGHAPVRTTLQNQQSNTRERSGRRSAANRGQPSRRQQ